MALLNLIIFAFEQNSWAFVPILACVLVYICAAIDPANQKKEGDTYDPNEDYFGL